MFSGTKISARWVTGLVTGLMVCAFVGVAMAGDPPAPPGGAPAAGGGTQSSSLFELVMQGGIIGFFIIGVSIVSLALCIQYLFQFKPEVLMPPEILTNLEGLLEEGNYEEAMTICEADQSFMGKVMRAGLAKVESGFDAMKEAADGTFNEEAMKMRGKVSWLATIAAIATQLGLFGTVVGMVIVFDKIAHAEGVPSPAVLAGGIGMALVTTVEGLLVAMPTLVALTFFKTKVEGLLYQTGNVITDLLEGFKNMEAAPEEEETV